MYTTQANTQARKYQPTNNQPFGFRSGNQNQPSRANTFSRSGHNKHSHQQSYQAAPTAFARSGNRHGTLDHPYGQGANENAQNDKPTNTTTDSQLQAFLQTQNKAQQRTTQCTQQRADAHDSVQSAQATLVSLQRRFEAASRTRRHELAAAETAAEQAMPPSPGSLQAIRLAALRQRRFEIEEREAHEDGRLEQLHAQREMEQELVQLTLTMPSKLRNLHKRLEQAEHAQLDQAIQEANAASQVLAKAEQLVQSAKEAETIANKAVQKRERHLAAEKQKADDARNKERERARQAVALAKQNAYVPPKKIAATYKPVPAANSSNQMPTTPFTSSKQFNTTTRACSDWGQPEHMTTSNNRWDNSKKPTRVDGPRDPDAYVDQNGRWWKKVPKHNKQSEYTREPGNPEYFSLVEFRQDRANGGWYTRTRFMRFHTKRGGRDKALQKWEAALPTEAELEKKKKEENAANHEGSSYLGPKRVLKLVQGKPTLVYVDQNGNVLGTVKSRSTQPRKAMVKQTEAKPKPTKIRTMYYSSPDVRAMELNEESGKYEYRPIRLGGA